MQRLLSWLLNTVYASAILVSLPLLVWAAVRKGKYREGFGQKLLGQVPSRSGGGFCVWLHAVSVGEVNLLGTILREILERHPQWSVYISTTTKAGYDLARRKYPQHVVFYCPLDFSWPVHRAMRRVRPHLLVLAELELWPNLIRAAKKHGAQVAIINGRLSDKSFRGYRRVKWLLAPVLQKLDLIAAQDASTAERFRALGADAECVHVTGSLKYDGAPTDRLNPGTCKFRKLGGFAEDCVVWLVGSTQSPEESIALDIFQRLAPSAPHLRLVIVPRHPERFDEVAQLLASRGTQYERRSALVDGKCAHSQVLLVDTIGELTAWWGTADIGFVGGSFGSRGGQNMIEPAAYGVATCFGPNTWNFRDIVAALLVADGAVVVRDSAELERFVERCLTEPGYASQLGERGRALVASQLGATQRTVTLLSDLVVRNGGTRRRIAA